uniref:Uncharacterized protein n=1 Tax=Avena sativa TaxID=4498 RepID=A0ACD5VN08_AVESA
MGFSPSSRSCGASALLLCLCMLLCRVLGGTPKLYIVYLGHVKHGHPDDVVASHHDMLATLLGSKEESSASVVYNYKHGFSGFAAMLTSEQAKQLAEFPEVISVEPSKTHMTATTRSWDFLGLNYHTPASTGQLHGTNYGEDACDQKINYGEDVIIGVVDSGIWPESRSFNDEGYGPVPSRWKGKCQVGPDWGINNCSRKIIGARFYTGGFPDELLKTDTLSPRDTNGHGTHCASTAAGSAVEAASFQGLAEGVARGGAPRARIAVYKSAWTAQGYVNTATVLAAIDDAIHDGVDVLSLSLTAPDENSFGALHAIQKGITVVYAGGNNGPRPQTIANTSPWAITVAASKIDRSFPTVITLGNKQQIVGQSFYYRVKNSTTSSFTSLTIASPCTVDVLNGTDLQGQILLCFPMPNDAFSPVSTFAVASQYVLKGGGIGLIFAQYTTDLLEATELFCQGIPCVLVDLDTAKKIGDYSDATSSPMAKIAPATTVTGKEMLAPKVASFSSRGPSAYYPDIIKPDIAAPGANILAAKEDSFVFKSGTSMAAPHVSGVVALLKALHPSWSPAAIKSAIVTSAHVTDERGMPILAEGIPRKIADPFDYGGGNINPLGAADPGLVYDIGPNEYTKFFGCTIIRRTNVSCDDTALPAYHLNLPSIAVSNLRRPVTVSRTVTNVGEVNSVYHAVVQSPAGVRMEVEPSVMVFNAANRVRMFKVTLSPVWKMQGDYTFGSITWRTDRKAVRIPVAARITAQDFYADVA